MVIVMVMVVVVGISAGLGFDVGSVLFCFVRFGVMTMMILNNERRRGMVFNRGCQQYHGPRNGVRRRGALRCVRV